MSTTGSVFYKSILYTKINENEAQVGDFSKKDRNALNGAECPESATFEQYVTIDSKQYTVTRVGIRSFRGCESLTSVEFADTIRIIEDYAFDHTKIKKLKLPKSCTTIGLWSFGSSYFESIEYPDNLQYLGNCPFSPSYGLTNFNVPNNHKYLSSDAQGALLDKDQTILYTVPALLTTYKIPDTVIKINGGAFQASSVETIIIPQKCTYLGYYAIRSGLLKNISILGNILFMDEQSIGENLKLINYHGSIPVSPDTNKFNLASFQVNHSKSCPKKIPKNFRYPPQ